MHVRRSELDTSNTHSDWQNVYYVVRMTVFFLQLKPGASFVLHALCICAARERKE